MLFYKKKKKRKKVAMLAQKKSLPLQAQTMFKLKSGHEEYLNFKDLSF